MPEYFGPVAATCPTSRDQPAVGPAGVYIRPTIPAASDLPSALAAFNLARNLFNQLITPHVVNNVFNHTTAGVVANVDPKMVYSRWAPQPAKTVKGHYVYYGRNADNTVDKDTWVVTERIEQMVWYDTVLKSYLVWTYGDKGEGQRIQGTSPPS